MSKRPYKYKLLLDENLAPRFRLPRLNEYYDVKHLRDDCHRGGMGDPAVYRFAVAQRRVLVTENWTDFRHLVGTRDDLGVIGVPSAWTTRQVDTKLTALLRRHPPAYFRGRCVRWAPRSKRERRSGTGTEGLVSYSPVSDGSSDLTSDTSPSPPACELHRPTVEAFLAKEPYGDGAASDQGARRRPGWLAGGGDGAVWLCRPRVRD